MIEVNVLDSAPGEGELLRNAALYFADRLFTKAQRKKLSVIIDVTAQPIRVPITRDMLMMKKGFIGASAPTMFELTVSTAAGLRDAMEVVAHELIHMSQAHNGRLIITKKKRKYDGEKRLVHMAKWLSGKSTPIEELQWHNRPWEVEACQWQPQLVNEFIGRSMGTAETPVTQKPKKKQLALYKVAPTLMTPAAMQPVPMNAPAPMNTPVPTQAVTPLAAPVAAAPVSPQPHMQPPMQQVPAPQHQPVQQVPAPEIPAPLTPPVAEPAEQSAANPAGIPQTQPVTPGTVPEPDMPLDSDLSADLPADLPADLAAVMDDEALIAALGGGDDLVPPVDIAQFDAPLDAAVDQGFPDPVTSDPGLSDGDLPDDLSAALSMEQTEMPAVAPVAPVAPLAQQAPAPAIDPVSAFEPVPAFDPSALSASISPPASDGPVASSAMSGVAEPGPDTAPAQEVSSQSGFGAAPDLSALTPHNGTADQPSSGVVDNTASPASDVTDDISSLDEDALAAMVTADIMDTKPEPEVIMVDVLGLNGPRELSQNAVDGKVDELLERGLITVEEAAIARKGTGSSAT